MKTKTRVNFLVAACLAAWMVAGLNASAQWNVIPPSKQPQQPVRGTQQGPPPRPQRQPGNVNRPPTRQPGQGSRLAPPPPPPPVGDVQRAPGAAPLKRRANPPRRRPEPPRVVHRNPRPAGYANAYAEGYADGYARGSGHGGYSGHGGRRDVVTFRDEVKQPPRARLPKGAVVVGELAAGGGAKEIAVNREISHCYLELVSGTVSINTVVVRPEKKALPQAVRLAPGQLHTIDLGGKRMVTGFRISDNGRGTYRVIVK
ncbi:MAG: hypothetical protein ACOX9C_07760 [Kiritimatiellia bacterium]|jgi:hypothetical protein